MDNSSLNQTAGTTIDDTISVETKSATKFILGSVVLLVLHFVSGYIQTPEIIVEKTVNPELSETYVRIFYGLGVVGLLAIPIPLGAALISLFFKAKRNVYSFFRVLSFSMAITLALNILNTFISVNFFPKQ